MALAAFAAVAAAVERGAFRADVACVGAVGHTVTNVHVLLHRALADPAIAGERLGHSSIAFTIDLWPTPSRAAAKAAQVVGDVILGGSKPPVW